MTFILGYHILYLMIIMGPYPKSLLIASIVGIIGIGICLVLERRWRNSEHVSSEESLSSSVWDLLRATHSETAADLSEECVSLNDNVSPDEECANKLNIITSNEAEDDVTYLYGPVSNLTVQEISMPGLPQINIDEIRTTKVMNREDTFSFFDMNDFSESQESETTESRSDRDTEEDLSELPWNTNSVEGSKLDEIETNSIETEINEKTIEAINEQLIVVPLMTEAAPLFNIENTGISRKECDDSINTEEEDATNLHHLHINLGSSELDEIETNSNEAEINETTVSEEPVTSIPSMPKDAEMFKSFVKEYDEWNKIEEKEGTDFIDFHSDEHLPEPQSTKYRDDDQIFDASPVSCQEPILEQKIQLDEERKESIVDDKSNSHLAECDVKPTLAACVISDMTKCTIELREDKFIPSSCKFDIVQGYSLPKWEVKGEKTPGCSQKETDVLFSSSPVIDCVSDVLPEVTSRNLNDTDATVDSSNNAILSNFGLGDNSHTKKTEETRLAQAVKDSLEETCVLPQSAASTSPTRKIIVENSTLEAENDEDGKKNNIVDNEPESDPQTDTGLTIIPKISIRADILKLNEDNAAEIHTDTENETIQKAPTHRPNSRVKNLVGFFENKK